MLRYVFMIEIIPKRGYNCNDICNNYKNKGDNNMSTHKRYVKKLRVLLVITIALSFIFPNIMPAMQSGQIVQASTKPMKLNKTSKFMDIGDTYLLKINNLGKNKVTWKSSNDKIAVVYKGGTVKAVNSGKAKITATVNKKKFTCEIDVSKPTIKPLSPNVNVGSTQQLTLEGVNDSLKVQWSVDDERVATIDSDGVITGVKSGTVIVTATVNKLKYTRQVNIIDNGSTSDSSTGIKKGTLLYEDDLVKMEYVALEFASDISNEKEQNLKLYVKITNKSPYEYRVDGKSITINGVSTTDFGMTNKIPSGATSVESMWVTYIYDTIDYNKVTSISGSGSLDASDRVFYNGTKYWYEFSF